MPLSFNSTSPVAFRMNQSTPSALSKFTEATGAGASGVLTVVHNAALDYVSVDRTNAISFWTNQRGASNDGVYDVASDPQAFGALGTGVLPILNNYVRGANNHGTGLPNSNSPDLVWVTSPVSNTTFASQTLTCAASTTQQVIRVWVNCVYYQYDPKPGLLGSHKLKVFASLGDGSAPATFDYVDLNSGGFTNTNVGFDITFKANGSTTLTFGLSDDPTGQSPIHPIAVLMAAGLFAV